MRIIRRDSPIDLDLDLDLDLDIAYTQEFADCLGVLELSESRMLFSLMDTDGDAQITVEATCSEMGLCMGF